MSLLMVLILLQGSSFAAFQTSAKTPSRDAAYFEFHSNFWVNLHQALFFKAVSEDKTTSTKEGLSASAAWIAAVDFYREHFKGRSLLFDRQLIQINDLLAAQPDDGNSLDASGLPPDVAKILQSAASSYRPLWPEADSHNRLWIKEMEPKVVALAPTVVPELETQLGMSWPEKPIRVDLSYYVHEIGQAYTTDDPPHSTISSTNAQNHGLAGLEIVFHEATHTMSRKVESALAAECRSQKKDCGDLWHALLFYTVGNAIQQNLPENERGKFTPYAYRFGLYNHDAWKTYRVVLEKDWQPYLGGQVGFDSAIRRLVGDL
jgi:hypothetical protein